MFLSRTTTGASRMALDAADREITMQEMDTLTSSVAMTTAHLKEVKSTCESLQAEISTLHTERAELQQALAIKEAELTTTSESAKRLSISMAERAALAEELSGELANRYEMATDLKGKLAAALSNVSAQEVRTVVVC